MTEFPTLIFTKRLDFSDISQDFLEFARWAFGNIGIPELQVLGLGDFAFEAFHWSLG